MRKFFNTNQLCDEVASLPVEGKMLAFKRRVCDWYLIPIHDTGHEAFMALLGWRAAVSCISTFTGFSERYVVLAALCVDPEAADILLQSTGSIMEVGALPGKCAICILDEGEHCRRNGDEVFFDPWNIVDSTRAWVENLESNTDQLRVFDQNLSRHLHRTMTHG